MTGAIEDGVLRFEGLTDAQIATLNKRLPDLMYYLALVKKEEARFLGMLNDLEPIVETVIKKQQEIT